MVAEEMLARVAGTAGWKDPHTRHGPGTQGRYTLLSAEPAASKLSTNDDRRAREAKLSELSLSFKLRVIR